MNEDSCSPAALLKRISELEQERDDLQLDIEQLCMQQSGISRKADAVTQIQAPRITTLKKELEVSKEKLEEYTKKNHKLQDELTELYNIKTQFADLLKSETDKNIELEKNIKYFQSTIASALIERDRAVLQVENRQNKEKELTEKVKSLEERLGLLTSELHDQREVVDFFWDIRIKECGMNYQVANHEKVSALLGDPQNLWTFGDRRRDLEVMCNQVKEGKILMAQLQEKYHASVNLVSRLTKDLEELATSKKLVEDLYLDHKEKMVHSVVILAEEIRQIQTSFFHFKRDMINTLKETAEWARTFYQDFQIKEETTHIHYNQRSENRDSTGEKMAIYHEIFKENHKGSQHAEEQTSDSQTLNTKEALALALQQKVSALLLLSQQEERHILEENTIAAQEYRIAILQKQLVQVMADKAKVLMELATLWGEFQKIQELHWVLPYSSYSHTINRRVPQAWSKAEGNEASQVIRNIGGSGQSRWIWSKASIPDSLKHSLTQVNDTNNCSHWIRRQWSKGAGHTQSLTSTRLREGCSVPRLQAENAALWDILSILQQLSGSIMGLQQRIAQAAKGPWDHHPHHSTLLLDSVVREGKELQSTLDAGLCQNIKSLAAPFAGALLNSVLLAAEVCKTYLTSREGTSQKLLL